MRNYQEEFCRDGDDQAMGGMGSLMSVVYLERGCGVLMSSKALLAILQYIREKATSRI